MWCQVGLKQIVERTGVVAGRCGGLFNCDSQGVILYTRSLSQVSTYVDNNFKFSLPYRRLIFKGFIFKKNCQNQEISLISKGWEALIVWQSYG